MAVNVDSLPWADALAAPRVAAARAHPLPLLLASDAVALVLPCPLASGLGWRGACFAGAALLALALNGHYRQRLAPVLAREVPALIGCVAVALVAVTILVGRPTDTQLLLRAGVVATLLLVLERGGSY